MKLALPTFTAPLTLPRLFALSALGLALLGPASAIGADKTYEIQKSAPAATVGSSAKASLTVQGKNGWHVNDEAPITVTLKADDGITLPKAKLARADLAQSTKETARFDIPFSASATGKKTITAEARFVMCQEQACKPEKETVALEIQVAAAGPPAPTAKEKAPSKAKKPKTATP